VRMSTTVTTDMVESGQYDEVFVATGAKERRLDIPGINAPNVTYAIDTLRHTQIQGDNVLVIGGGLTGCEIAYDLARQGKKVTIIEMTETILNAFGLSAANYNMLMELIDYYDIDVYKNTVLEKYEDGVAYILETIKNYPNTANRAYHMFALGTQGIPKRGKLPIDHIVVSVGYTSDDALYQAINKEHIHLIGDAKQPTNIMDAIWAAFEVAMTV